MRIKLSAKHKKHFAARKSGKVGSIEKIPMGQGEKPITFHKGGLHESLNVPQGQKIPESKMQAALNGSYGPTAQKQARLAQTMKKWKHK
jgi:hypothetical protein